MAAAIQKLQNQNAMLLEAVEEKSRQVQIDPANCDYSWNLPLIMCKVHGVMDSVCNYVVLPIGELKVFCVGFEEILR